MRKQLAEQWAIQVLEAIALHGPYEDARVELKKQIGETERLARQLAGMANAARGETVLVLIGVDQRDGVVGTDPFETGDWLAAIRSWFEGGHAPNPFHSPFLTFQDKLVAAFFFETDDAPYVIGSGKKGGPREVLWRFGSRTEPAGRAELLKLLVQRVAAPEIEVQKAEIRLNRDGKAYAHVEFYLYPSRSLPELFIPFHRVEVQVFEATDAVTFSESVSMSPVSPGSSLAQIVDRSIKIEGPSRIRLSASVGSAAPLSANASLLSLRFGFLPAHFDAPVLCPIPVAKREHPDHAGYWELLSDHTKPLDTVRDQLKRLESILPEPFESPFPSLPPPRW